MFTEKIKHVKMHALLEKSALNNVHDQS